MKRIPKCIFIRTSFELLINLCIKKIFFLNGIKKKEQVLKTLNEILKVDSIFMLVKHFTGIY